MKKIFNIILVIAIITAIVPIPGCDIVEEPYLVPAGNTDGPGPDENIRKILLEDYTGQQCPNCPEAAIIAHDLKIIYGEQLILMAVHAGIYSEPEATGLFTTDYRTPEGSDLNSFFDFPGYPMGMVNRTEYSSNKLLLKDFWEGAVEVQSKLEAQADIEITHTFSSATRKLDCSISTTFLEDMEGVYNICVFITESGIISPQKTRTGIDTTYVHNHVLRASMNGTWGDVAGNDGLALEGVVLTNNYSYTLPSAWNESNCSIIAFVYNPASNEIIQAEEKDL